MSLAKKIALFLSDIITLYLALFITLLIRYGTASLREHWQAHFVPFSLLFLIWLLMFYLADLYRPRATRNRLALFRTLFIAVVIAAVLSTVVLYLFQSSFELTPKTNLLIFSAVFLALNYFSRYSLLRVFTAGALGVAFLGESPLAAELVAYLRENPQTGYRVVQTTPHVSKEVPSALKDAIQKRDVQIVVIQPHLAKDFKTLAAVYRLLPLEVGIMNFLDFYETVFEKVPLDELDEGWFLENVATRRPFYDALKRLVDLCIASVVAVVFSPFMILSALLIKLTSPGPVIFKQERVGKNGVPFMLYKFRTMIVNHGGPLWTEKNDSRLTPIGKILNFTHLNELPQIVNVWRGDISLTGPRAQRVELARQFEQLPYYDMRHLVKPGVTGWAQVNYKPSASLEEAHEKLRYDIYYVKNRSLFLDFMIILKTLKYVFTSNS